jgi:hypothetical protein
MTASLPPGSPEAGEDRGASADNMPTTRRNIDGSPVFGDIEFCTRPPSI